MTVIEQQIPSGTWRLDTVHSSVDFEVKHMMVSTFRGGFEEFDATLTSGDDGVRLSGVVQADSLKVRDENLAGHLRSAEFFDTDRYPEIRFESTSIRIEGDEAILEGDLTIKGNTNRVTARGAYVGPHEDILGNTKIGLSFETVVDRTRFGLEWNAPLPSGGFALSNEVTLIVELELAKA